MASRTTDYLIRNLSFDVEAVPNQNAPMKTSNSGAPMSVKIRVRNKDGILHKNTVLTIPNISHPGKGPDRVRLAGSDQTIMSFDLYMETDGGKKPSKKHRKLFGGCFGTQSDDDEGLYEPSIAQRDSKSDADLTLQKNSVNSPDNAGSGNTKLFGKCKPGGCLDPPFGEERYQYKPRISKNRNTPIKDLAIDLEKDEILTENLKNNIRQSRDQVVVLPVPVKSPETLKETLSLHDNTHDEKSSIGSYSRIINIKPFDVNETQVDKKSFDIDSNGRAQTLNILYQPNNYKDTESRNHSPDLDNTAVYSVREKERQTKQKKLRSGGKQSIEDTQNTMFDETDSIITYPYVISSSELEVEEKKKERKVSKRNYSPSKTRQSPDEFTNMFFIPPRKDDTRENSSSLLEISQENISTKTTQKLRGAPQIETRDEESHKDTDIDKTIETIVPIPEGNLTPIDKIKRPEQDDNIILNTKHTQVITDSLDEDINIESNEIQTQKQKYIIDDNIVIQNIEIQKQIPSLNDSLKSKHTKDDDIVLKGSQTQNQTFSIDDTQKPLKYQQNTAENDDIVIQGSEKQEQTDVTNDSKNYTLKPQYLNTANDDIVLQDGETQKQTFYINDTEKPLKYKQQNTADDIVMQGTEKQRPTDVTNDSSSDSLTPSKHLNTADDDIVLQDGETENQTSSANDTQKPLKYKHQNTADDDIFMQVSEKEKPIDFTNDSINNTLKLPKSKHLNTVDDDIVSRGGETEKQASSVNDTQQPLKYKQRNSAEDDIVMQVSKKQQPRDVTNDSTNDTLKLPQSTSKHLNTADDEIVSQAGETKKQTFIVNDSNKLLKNKQRNIADDDIVIQGSEKQKPTDSINDTYYDTVKPSKSKHLNTVDDDVDAQGDEAQKQTSSVNDKPKMPDTADDEIVVQGSEQQKQRDVSNYTLKQPKLNQLDTAVNEVIMKGSETQKETSSTNDLLKQLKLKKSTQESSAISTPSSTGQHRSFPLRQDSISVNDPREPVNNEESGQNTANNMKYNIDDQNSNNDSLIVDNDYVNKYISKKDKIAKHTDLVIGKYVPADDSMTENIALLDEIRAASAENLDASHNLPDTYNNRSSKGYNNLPEHTKEDSFPNYETVKHNFSPMQTNEKHAFENIFTQAQYPNNLSSSELDPSNTSNQKNIPSENEFYDITVDTVSKSSSPEDKISSNTEYNAHLPVTQIHGSIDNATYSKDNVGIRSHDGSDGTSINLIPPPKTQRDTQKVEVNESLEENANKTFGGTRPDVETTYKQNNDVTASYMEGSRGGQQKESIFLDLVFQKTPNDASNKLFVKTLDPASHPKQNNGQVIVVKTVLNLENHKVRVPLDDYNELSIQYRKVRSLSPESIGRVSFILTESSNQKPVESTKPVVGSMYGTLESLNMKDEMKDHTMAQRHPLATLERSPTINDIHQTLSAIYEKQLVPLQKTIKNLKEDIDFLKSQQHLLRSHVQGSSSNRRFRPVRLVHSSKRCVCISPRY